MRPLSLAAHSLEMIGAMTLGMLVSPPLIRTARGALPDANWVRNIQSVVDTTPEAQVLLMGTTMILPATIWMCLRRHRPSTVLEMALAMYAGFVVLFPTYWLGLLDAGQMLMPSHVLMVVFMLIAIFARQRQYTALTEPAAPLPAKHEEGMASGVEARS